MDQGAALDPHGKPVGNDDFIRRLIAERAYEIWENHGRIHGYDVLHWHEAEQEVLSCLAAAVAARPTGAADASPPPTV